MDNKVKSLQSYLLIQLLKTFDIECKKMQTQLLNRRIENEYIDEIVITDETGNDVDKIINKFGDNPKLKLIKNIMIK